MKESRGKGLGEKDGWEKKKRTEGRKGKMDKHLRRLKKKHVNAAKSSNNSIIQELLPLQPRGKRGKKLGDGVRKARALNGRARST